MKGCRKCRKRVDWSKKVGIFGYSMGGEATVLTAANKKAVKELNIGVAVSMHPSLKFSEYR